MPDQQVEVIMAALFDAPATILHSDRDYWLGAGRVGGCRVAVLAGDAPHLDVLQAVAGKNDLTVFAHCQSGESAEVSTYAPWIYVALAVDSPVATLTALNSEYCIDVTQSATLIAQAADVTCTDSGEAYSVARRFIRQTRPISGVPVDRLSEQLLQRVPADPYTPYDMQEVLAILLDDQPSLLRNSDGHLLTGLAQIGGMPLALMASQPSHDRGRLQVGDCIAAQRLMHLAQRLQLPIVVLQDTQGLGVDEVGVNDAVVAMLQTWQDITVPVVTVLLGCAFGLAHTALAGTGTRPTAQLAWPRAQIALDAPASYSKQADVMLAAHGFGVHEVIDPRDTRTCVSQWLQLLQTGAQS